MKTFASWPQTSLPPFLWPLLLGGSSTANSHMVREPVIPPRLVSSPSRRCLLQHQAHRPLMKIPLCTAIFQAESSRQRCPFPARQVGVPAWLEDHCLPQGWPSLCEGVWHLGEWVGTGQVGLRYVTECKAKPQHVWGCIRMSPGFWKQQLALGTIRGRKVSVWAEVPQPSPGLWAGE